MSRFFRRGVTKIQFLPNWSATSPSGGEISAGTDLTGSISNITGWDFANTPIATPDLSTTFDTQIGGPDTAQSPTIEFYDDDTTATIRAALVKGTAGFILRAPYGTATGKRCEKFPIKTTSLNDNYSLGNDAAKFTVGFAITAAPTLVGATMP